MGRKRRKKKIRYCRECGTKLPEGYWRLCPDCHKQLLYESEKEIGDDYKKDYEIHIDWDDLDF